MGGVIPLEKAKRQAMARNQGAGPGREFSESNPPPVNSENDYGAADISAGEPGPAPDDADSIYGRAEEAGEPNGQDQHSNTKYDHLCLTLEQWEKRDVPPPDFLLGRVLSTTTRAMISAETGLGKTHLGFALGFAMTAGRPFCHWGASRPSRVLIVDGEMYRRLVKERLADAARRIGQKPGALFMLCKEDVENMSSLDTEEGQR